MKLKNKKTGEICELKVAVNGDLTLTIDDEIIGIYSSLAELNEEWKDYEEPPKGYWFVRDVGGVCYSSVIDNPFSVDVGIEREAFGNYFETEEEAKKAVEKLKAWKRLKDKGFRFDKWANASAGPYRPIWFYFEKDTALEDIKSDLDLLFRGEE